MEPFEHENTIYGAYGEFEPWPDEPVDWDEHNAQADEWFATYSEE